MIWQWYCITSTWRWKSNKAYNAMSTSITIPLFFISASRKAHLSLTPLREPHTHSASSWFDRKSTSTFSLADMHMTSNLITLKHRKNFNQATYQPVYPIHVQSVGYEYIQSSWRFSLARLALATTPKPDKDSLCLCQCLCICQEISRISFGMN